MARTLSSPAQRAAYAQETGEVFLVLLTINHATLPAPIRVVNDTQNIVSGGNTYLGFNFTIVLPDEREDQPPRSRVVIDCIDRSIIAALRPLTSPPTLDIQVVLASSPNTIEASFTGFSLRQINYDAMQIEGELTMEEITMEPFPEGSMTPQDFPGLYG